MPPKSVIFHKKTKNIQFLIKGQGVFLFEAGTDPCAFCVYDKTASTSLLVTITAQSVLASKDGTQFLDPTNTKGLTTPGASYWFSLDAQNRRISVGIGEARIETVIYKYQFQATDTWLENLERIQLTDQIPLRLLRDPITRSVPLQVQDNITMDDIATDKYMPSANLSLTAQKLYNCIKGKAFQLDNSFAKAIEYSIATPGCWCYETLKAKSQEFGPSDPKETYLRITLSENNGESPGIPYVMEIWPAGHYSPVHNHGGSSAIIRVLHGGIHVKLFPFLGAESFGSADFKKDDITWISPALNQVHQLQNQGTQTCITIQCYMYESEDTQHYEYFDYLDKAGNVQKFEPNSDMDFVKFKETVRKEWARRFWCM